MTFFILMSLLLSIEGNQQADDASCNCCTEHYQQFDFWIGKWEVFDPNGELVGENEITQVQGNCVLQENWKGAGGSAGTSLNYYDATTEKWHQVWVDNTGGVLKLSGQFEKNQMILESELIYSEKQKGNYRNRITWTNNTDGTVRQLWEVVKENGEVWGVLFDGTYKKKV